MSCEISLRLEGVSKCFYLYEKPIYRVFAALPWNREKVYAKEFWALKDVSIEIKKGESVGIIGRNGAGKSTLLQLICKTLTPTEGSVEVHGKIAALLELGSGFNPEFSGRENIFFSSAIAGMSKKEIEAKYESIVSFSEVEKFIDQSVKTYSSGMMMKLAFSVATSIEPDVLVIDEALSVGDGAFARKSFDRIMKLKDGGATILFCSHSLFQVEALCDRVVWMENGSVKMMGSPSEVIPYYEASLDDSFIAEPHKERVLDVKKTFRLRSVTMQSNATLRSGVDSLVLLVEYNFDTMKASPTLIFEIFNINGQTVTSGVSNVDGILLEGDEEGVGRVEICFEKIKLMRGRYRVDFYLMCEKGIHPYDHAASCVVFEVTQEHHEKGFVFLEHTWKQM
jgi:lipopolysaccharide transport system ATP-binding protein